jgi:hypothetical protein
LAKAGGAGLFTVRELKLVKADAVSSLMLWSPGGSVRQRQRGTERLDRQVQVRRSRQRRHRDLNRERSWPAEGN